MNQLPQLLAGFVSIAAAIAVASLMIAALGLLAARFGRRSPPLQHGLLTCTLLVLLTLPATPFAATFLEFGWLPRLGVFDVPTSARAAEGATESASAPTTASENSAYKTLSPDEIPAGAILPGQRSTRFRPSATERRGSEQPSAGATGSASAFARLTNIDRSLITHALLAIWLLGSLVSTIRTLRSGLAVARVARRAAPVTNRALQSLLTQLSDESRLRRPPQLKLSSTVRVPFAWGLGRPVIVLPRQLLDADAAQLRPILLHELAHVSRRDAWVGVLQRIVAAMYWWNPLVRMLNSRLADAREQICDAHVLAGGCAPRDYAELLVALASHVALPQPAAALGLLSRSRPQLTRRVQHLLEDQPMSTSLRKLGKLALFGLMIILTTSAVLMAYVVLENQGALAGTRQWITGDQPRIRIQTPVVLTSASQVTAEAPAMMAEAAPQQFTQPEQFLFAEADPFTADTASTVPDVAGEALPDEFDPFTESEVPFDSVAAEPQLDQDPFGDFAQAESVPTDEGSFFQPTTSDHAAATAPPSSGEFEPGPESSRRNRFEGAFNTIHSEEEASPPFTDQKGHGFNVQKLHGLALIGLSANPDGSLKELRWFTESLGADDEACAKLTDRLSNFATERAQSAQDGRPLSSFGGGARPSGNDGIMFGLPPKPDTRTAAQINASPVLRYADVMRVIEICHKQHIDQIFFGDGENEKAPDVTLTLGFVRDAGGKKISSSPVLIWKRINVNSNIPVLDEEQNAMTYEKTTDDVIVTVQDLPQQLLNWRQTFPLEAQPTHLSALVCTDDGVESKLVEQVIQAALPAGIERVDIRWLTPPTEKSSDGDFKLQ